MHSTFLDAIRKFEGFTSKADWDYAQFTNGYGTKAKYAGEVIDKAEADRRFQTEIAQARAIVDRHAPNVDEGTKAALTSLTFNAGDKWAKSGLGDAVRSGDTERAKDLFLQYNKAGGEVLPGLAQRRIAEAAWIGQNIGAGTSAPTVTAAIASGPVMARQTPTPGLAFLGATTAPFDLRGPAAPTLPPSDPLAQPGELAQAAAKTDVEIEDELLSKIRGAVSGFGGEARMTQLLLASKLIGAPSSQDAKADQTNGGNGALG